MARKKVLATPTKTESINVRLDPKLRYGLELLMRKQRRSITSVVEWALEKAIRDPKDGLYEDNESLLQKLWDVDSKDRLLLLAKYKPGLLTFEEEKYLKKEKE